MTVQHHMYSIGLAGTEAGSCFLDKVLHDEGQVGKARYPDKLVHRGLQGKGHPPQGQAGALPSMWRWDLRRRRGRG